MSEHEYELTGEQSIDDESQVATDEAPSVARIAERVPLRPDLVGELRDTYRPSTDAIPLARPDLNTFGIGWLNPEGSVGYPGAATAAKGRARIDGIVAGMLAQSPDPDVLPAEPRRPLEVVAHQRRGRGRIEERLAPHGGPARLDQVAVGGRLEHVSRRAGLQRLEEVLLVVVHRQDQDAQIGQPPVQVVGNLKPGQLRHRARIPLRKESDHSPDAARGRSAGALRVSARTRQATRPAPATRACTSLGWSVSGIP